MENETLWQRIKRLFKSEAGRDHAAISGMSGEEKRAGSILIVVLLCIAILAALVYTAKSRADVSVVELPLRFKCSLGSTVCEVDRIGFEKLLLSNRTAVEEVERLKAQAVPVACSSRT